MGRKPKAETFKSMAHMLVEREPKVHKNSVGLSVTKKASNDKSVIVRRSGRLQNSVLPVRNQELESLAEEINLVESEREDEAHVEECTPEPTSGEKSWEEKIDHLVETVEELKANKRHVSSRLTSIDIKYKSLYIDSQKKIETLTDENYQLSKKLEIALAKLEAYENVKEVIEKLKDVIMISNLSKATEAAINLSAQAILGGFSSPGPAVVPPSPSKRKRPSSPAKRKRRSKESEKN